MEYKKTALYQKALAYASEAHKDQFRKGSDIPYITHPVEVADIIASLTDDEEMIAAGLLHDVVEDTDRTEEDIRSCFGDRIADLIAAETEDKMRNQRAEDTWVLRKSNTLKRLEHASREAKILALADKLANLRSIDRDYLMLGDAIWNRFNQKDPKLQGWYYKTVSDLTRELSGFDAWQEYTGLCEKVFG